MTPETQAMVAIMEVLTPEAQRDLLSLAESYRNKVPGAVASPPTPAIRGEAQRRSRRPRADGATILRLVPRSDGSR